jgi:hypothetical protein
MITYQTPEEKIPEEVVRKWQNFAVDYALKNMLPTKPDPDKWEVMNVIPGAFPSVGALLWQYENRGGNCAKIVLFPGYNDIIRVQDALGELPGYQNIDYSGGMVAPLHSHPKLVFKGENFFGSVVDETGRDQKRIFRVRFIDYGTGFATSDIYAQLVTSEKIKTNFGVPTGIIPAEIISREATIDLLDKKASGYPNRITTKSLEEYLQEKEHRMLEDVSMQDLFTIRTGKQEQFVGFSDAPLYLGGFGENNLLDSGLEIPRVMERNVGKEYRNIQELKKGEVSPPVKWHWVLAGKDTAAFWEISGMPHLSQGSIDAGDIFYVENAKEVDPLYLEFVRKTILEGH